MAKGFKKVRRDARVAETVDLKTYFRQLPKIFLYELKASIEHNRNALVIRERFIMLDHPPVLQPNDSHLHKGLHFLFYLLARVLVPPLNEEGKVGPNEALSSKNVVLSDRLRAF